MNKFIKKLTLSLVGALCFCSAPVSAEQLIIALSPHVSEDVAKAQNTDILKAVSQMDAGSSVTIMDGYTLKTLGTFKVPEGKAYGSVKARLNANRSVIGALKRRTHAHDENRIPASIKLPQLLRHIAHGRTSEESIGLIVLASAFYDDPLDPNASMRGALVPGDGHIRASRGVSPFGAKESKSLLKNITLYFAFPEDTEFVSGRHRFYVERFWMLYLEAQGGKIGSFFSDFNAVFKRAIQHSKPFPHDFTLEKDTTLEMIRFQKQDSSVSIFDRKISTRALAKHKVHSAHQVMMGLNWEGCESCDLDLYAKPSTSAAILFYNNKSTPFGAHWKDYTSSPKAQNRFETISFHVPVDLINLIIAINHFDGIANKPMAVELRIAVDDQVFSKRYKLPSQEGNGGVDVFEGFNSGRAIAPQTLLIKPLNVITL